VDSRTVIHPSGRSSHVRWLILLLIVVASFVSYVLRTNLSIVGPSLIAELGISEFKLGMVLSAFALGYAIFQFPGGIFGDIVGPRLAGTLMAVAWGLLTVLSGLVPGGTAASGSVVVAYLLAIRFLVGVTHAPIFPVMAGGMVSNWFPVSAWGLPNGLSSTGLTLGAAATPPLIVWLMVLVGWRGSFLATAPAAFLLVSEHRAHALGYLPFLLLLACPLLHVFMHGGHGQGGHGGHAGPGRKGGDIDRANDSSGGA